MSTRRLTVGFCLIVTLVLIAQIGLRAQVTDDVFLVYARTAKEQIKLIRFITEFPGAFPTSMMKAADLSMVLLRSGDTSVVAGSRPALDKATLDSIINWLVPFNPGRIDTFGLAMRVVPLRTAIAERSKLLGSWSSRLVSRSPWFRKGISPSDTAGGKPRPGFNNFRTSYTEPDFNTDTLGSYIFYPPQARGRGLNGEVQVAALVGSDGFVEDLVILNSSHDVFDQSAARAVRCLRFQPGRVGNVPTRMWVTFPIAFSPS